VICPVCGELTPLGEDGVESLPQNLPLAALVKRLEKKKRTCGEFNLGSFHCTRMCMCVCMGVFFHSWMTIHVMSFAHGM
jgi:hypothetical protein